MSKVESISQILSIGEQPFFDLADELQNRGGNEPVDISEDIDEHIQHLIDNPCEMMGISTGFQRFDAAIGGGLRKGNVDLIGARTKAGKSFFADTVALHVAGKLNIPVLVLDTEMQKEDHVHRILANMSDIEINDICTGKFGKSEGTKKRVQQAAEKLKKMPYKYVTIAGVDLMKSWRLLDVGLKGKLVEMRNGNTNPCVVIYDYLKLTSASQLAT